MHVGIKGTIGDENCSSNEELEKSVKKTGEGTSTQKTAHLMWTPFLQRKFVHAVELLGKGTISIRIVPHNFWISDSCKYAC